MAHVGAAHIEYPGWGVLSISTKGFFPNSKSRLYVHQESGVVVV